MTSRNMPSLSPAMLTSLAQSFSSLSTLCVAFALLQGASSYAFGQFSVLQLVLVLGLLVQTAVVQAPLLLLQAKSAEGAAPLAPQHGVLVLGAYLAPFAALSMVIIAVWADWTAIEVILAALAVGLQTRRSVQRFYGQNQQQFASVARVDLKVACVTMLLVALGVWAELFSLSWALAAINLPLLAFRYPLISFRQWRLAASQRQEVKAAFVAQGKPALKGALLSELMSNGHSYWIALCVGAQALAPYAAAALVFRPATVLAQSIVQASRASIARRVQQLQGQGQHDGLGQALSPILNPVRRQLWLAYISDVVPALLFLAVWPELLWPDGLTGEFLLALLLAALLTALRLYRQIPIMVLQAQDQFEVLYRLQKLPALLGGGAAFLVVFYSAACSMVCIVLAEACVAFQMYRWMHKMKEHPCR